VALLLDIKKTTDERQTIDGRQSRRRSDRGRRVKAVVIARGQIDEKGMREIVCISVVEESRVVKLENQPTYRQRLYLSEEE